MLISRTPYRLSLFGGGTDYPDWYRQHGGAVLAGTIDKYCYLTVRYLPPFFEHRIRVVWSRIETCNSIAEIQHPAARAVLEYFKFDRGIEIHHDGDLPARSGVGSSSSFTVGLLHALHALHGRMASRRQLADEAIHIERDVLREVVGCQDQILASYGGLNHVTFRPSDDYVVYPLTVSGRRVQDLSDHLMLFYTGIKRTASDVARSYVSDLGSKTRQLRVMQAMVDEAVQVLGGPGPVTDLGLLMHEAWQLKKGLGSSVSNADVDRMYDAARDAGALGGKLVGAGGGGFMLIMVPKARQDDVRAALGAHLHVPFRFQPAGSEIIFFDPEQEYLDAEARRASTEFAAFREHRTLDAG